MILPYSLSWDFVQMNQDLETSSSNKIFPTLMATFIWWLTKGASVKTSRQQKQMRALSLFQKKNEIFQKLDTPRKTNMTSWKNNHLKMYHLLNMGIFHSYVSFFA